MFGSYLEAVFLFMAKRDKYLTEFELIPSGAYVVIFCLK